MILICKTLSPFYQRMLYAKIGLNWPISSGKKKFNIFRKYIFGISWLPPLEKGHGPSLEQTGILITQGCFVPSLVEIGQFVMGKNFFFYISANVFTLFRNYLPLENGVALYFDKLESPLPKRLCVKFGWNYPAVL